MAAHPESDYEWLELLYQVSPSFPAGHSLRHFLWTDWSNLAAGISMGGKQPEVHPWANAQELPCWYLYDPVTKQLIKVISTQEILDWLRAQG